MREHPFATPRRATQTWASRYSQHQYGAPHVCSLATQAAAAHAREMTAPEDTALTEQKRIMVDLHALHRRAYITPRRQERLRGAALETASGGRR